MTAAELGSISSGTLRTEDLLEALADELEGILQAEDGGADPDVMQVIREARELLDVGPDNWTDHQQEAASWLVNEDLMDALNEHAPPYCYFGAHEGDGADFGYWLSDDAIRDAIQDGEILPVSDDRNAKYRQVPEYILHTNDHGNQTLYRLDLTEVWAVV